MNVRMYKCMCRYKDEPGAGFGWVYVQASNPFEVYQFLKAQQGDCFSRSMRSLRKKLGNKVVDFWTSLCYTNKVK